MATSIQVHAYEPFGQIPVKSEKFLPQVDFIEIVGDFILLLHKLDFADHGILHHYDSFFPVIYARFHGHHAYLHIEAPLETMKEHFLLAKYEDEQSCYGFLCFILDGFVQAGGFIS